MTAANYAFHFRGYAVPAAPEQRQPDYSAVFNGLVGLGYEPEVVGEFMSFLREVSTRSRVRGRTFATGLAQNRDVHCLLMRVMPEGRGAKRRSLHDKLNHLFLHDGSVFVHGYSGGCVIEIRPRVGPRRN